MSSTWESVIKAFCLQHDYDHEHTRRAISHAQNPWTDKAKRDTYIADEFDTAITISGWMTVAFYVLTVGTCSRLAARPLPHRWYSNMVPIVLLALGSTTQCLRDSRLERRVTYKVLWAAAHGNENRNAVK